MSLSIVSYDSQNLQALFDIMTLVTLEQSYSRFESLRNWIFYALKDQNYTYCAYVVFRLALHILGLDFFFWPGYFKRPSAQQSQTSESWRQPSDKQQGGHIWVATILRN